MLLRRFAAMAIVFGLAGIFLAGLAFRTALADPVVRRAEIVLPGLARDQPLKLLLVSDIHVAGPDMPPARLGRIVKSINRLRPDVVLIAGDFVSDKFVSTRGYGVVEAVSPLAALRPSLGTFAVLGNHDHWRDTTQMRLALERAGIRVLANNAARAGPLAIGGLDDPFTKRDDVAGTVQALARVGGVPIVLSHSPDPFPALPRSARLMLAGHTHCGQIRLPWIGALSTMSEHGDRYACGLMRENGKVLVVGAGLGTSLLPFRLGAVPDMWLLTLRAADEG